MAGLIPGMSKKIRVSLVNTALLVTRLYDYGYVSAALAMSAGNYALAAERISSRSSVDQITARAIEDRIIEFITGKKAKIDLGDIVIEV